MTVESPPLPPRPSFPSRSNNYDHIFVLDALLWCTVATFCLYYSVKQNNALYLLVVAFAESKLGLIAHEACHKAAPYFLSYLYDCAGGSRLMVSTFTFSSRGDILVV